ncbi:hypothetical protein [Nonomuraea soli]|uniref:Fungal lipase-like domain-containing protein n=1 Tax=Nonomuraea soli TaxID=1032476 RepID=A0A7W0CUX3_9ACTN|nr:hypothetical protein [Nonomuraea soli]MBA2897827.1 hypothetical protein [Nonomuraea soli]
MNDGHAHPDGAADAEPLRAAARVFVEVATAVQEASAHATAALTDSRTLRASVRAPLPWYQAERALAHALTNGRGLGYALTGGRLGGLAARLGGLLGQESLAVLLLATSLRLRIAAVALHHPELHADAHLRRLITAVSEDRDLAALRAMRTLLKDRGAVRALSDLAPVFGEVLALKALLDENPLNDRTAWLIATGTRYADADPVLGISNGFVAALDRGQGAARRTEPAPGEAVRLRDRGSLLDFLANIGTLGPTGRVLIQSVTGPDGVERHVVQAPGMRMGRPDTDSPQDLLGAFSSSVLASSPFSRALVKAVDDYGIPQGGELALVGHSAGGSAIMNLVQDPGFCARYTVTHAVAVGSPVDFKRPADPRTWVASVTNQHDIIPTLDGQGAGTCFDLHPDWYVVDYFDPTHLFPACHSIEHYCANLTRDLPEAREHIDDRLSPYRGQVTRSRIYRLYDDPPRPDGYPFLSVPTRREEGLEMPIRCRAGSALSAFFTADPRAAAALVDEHGLGRCVRLGGRALVVVHVGANHDTSAGPYREVMLGVVVHDPWGARPLRVWPDLARSAQFRRAGVCLLASAVDNRDLAGRAGSLWGYRPTFTDVSVAVAGGGVDLRVEPALTLRGRLGPALGVVSGDLVGFARDGRAAYRSVIRSARRARVHPAPTVRLSVGTPADPLTRLAGELGLDGRRALFCTSVPVHQTLRDAGVPIQTT